MFRIGWDHFSYPRKQFGIWRAAFGLYLIFCYARIYPYAVELYSRQGAHPGWSPDFPRSFFPKFLLAYDSVSDVRGIIISCIVLSLLIMLGFYRRVAAFFLWCLVMWLFNRNPFANSPEYSFINWLIFACIFIPSGESFSFSPKNLNWKMPEFFYKGAWIVLAVGYFFAASGKIKSHDPAWMDGTAMYYVFALDNARFAWYGSFFEGIPKYFFIPLTYGALLLQLAAPVFVAIRKSRPWWWLLSTATHFGLLFLVDLGQVTFGMLVFHAFIFDQSWLGRKPFNIFSGTGKPGT